MHRHISSDSDFQSLKWRESNFAFFNPAEKTIFKGDCPSAHYLAIKNSYNRDIGSK